MIVGTSDGDPPLRPSRSASSRRRGGVVRIVAPLVALVLMYAWSAGTLQETSAQSNLAKPYLIFVAFSPEVAPSNSQPFRQALAYAIDRDAVAKATQVASKEPYYPAPTIEHPRLPGFNQDAPGYSYDPVKAKMLYTQSGWTGPITITTPPTGARSVGAAILAAVGDSIRRTLDAELVHQEAASMDRLLVSARRGQVSAIMSGWGSNRRDYGYPSFALGLADDLDFSRRDPDLTMLLQRGDSKSVEQVLLEKALIIPIVHT